MEQTRPKPLVSIIMAACNNLDYTKLGVESLYEHTTNFDFELITVNSGSSDGTEEFFNSLPNQKKISISPNCGIARAFNEGLQLADGEFTVFLINSVVLTTNWLDNLLKCVQADEKTGMVVPASNSAEYFQQVNLSYVNKEELGRATEKYNRSDASKWEERLRLVCYVSLSRTELLNNLGGFYELYTTQLLADADLSFRIRRAGYKLILARDTYVHYFGAAMDNHSATKDAGERDRRIFTARFGVDALDDTDVDFELVRHVDGKQGNGNDVKRGDYNRGGDGRTTDVNILGIGLRCGGTLLQIKNWFREHGIRDVRLWGVALDDKYLADLKTICAEAVWADLDSISKIYQGRKFDTLVLDSLEGLGGLQVLNDTSGFLKQLRNILKGDGQLIFPVANQLFYLNVMKLLNGNPHLQGERMTTRYFNLTKLAKYLEKSGFTELKITVTEINPPAEDNVFVQSLRDLKNLTLLEQSDPAGDLWCVRRVIFSAKGLKPRRNILLYPGYDYLRRGIAFEDGNFGNSLGVDSGENFLWVLREELGKYGYTLSTLDEPDDIDDVEWIIFYDVPKHYGNDCFRGMYHLVCLGKIYFDEVRRRKALGKTKVRLAVILNEPPCVMPENFAESILADFDLVFTYCDDLTDDQKYCKFYTPQPASVTNPYARGYAEKKLCTFVGANKSSLIDGELYSERRQAILFFQENHNNEFDFYGRFWEGCGLGCYKGAIDNKLKTLSRYKFSICYENCSLNGWISEKIFDSFFAGCVPIYLGAPNITDYIPAKTFIDKRQFADYAQLYEFISTIKEDEYNSYLRNIESFLKSEDFRKFTKQSFARDIARMLMGNRSTSLERI